jgi:hypothetical protein
VWKNLGLKCGVRIELCSLYVALRALRPWKEGTRKDSDCVGKILIWLLLMNTEHNACLCFHMIVSSPGLSLFALNPFSIVDGSCLVV